MKTKHSASSAYILLLSVVWIKCKGGGGNSVNRAELLYLDLVISLEAESRVGCDALGDGGGGKSNFRWKMKWAQLSWELFNIDKSISI